MFSQAAIVSYVIRREHELDVSPTRLERRRIMHAVETLRCCSDGGCESGRPALFGGQAAPNRAAC